MSYRLLALRDVPRLTVRAGETFHTWSIGLCCELVRQGAAEPADARTDRDVEIAVCLQDLARSERLAA